SEEHTSELQSLTNIVCRLLLEKKEPGSSVPKAHGKAVVQSPVVEMKVSPEGVGSFTETSTAEDGPALGTTSVSTTSFPGTVFVWPARVTYWSHSGVSWSASQPETGELPPTPAGLSAWAVLVTSPRASAATVSFFRKAALLPACSFSLAGRSPA